MKKKSYIKQIHQLFSSGNKLSFIISGIIILTAGFLFGSALGSILITGLITKGNRTAFLLYRPSSEYIITARLLGSSSELLRLSGYYSLLDNRRIDNNFLIERYKKEPDYIKRSIIWILGYSENPKSVLSFLSEEYNDASKYLKREMLKSMKRIDKTYYTDFIVKHGINKTFTEGL